MAKRKDSVALFEVIKAQKSREAKAAAANIEPAQPAPLRTPKWWFKRSPGTQAQLPASDPFATPALPPPAEAAPPPAPAVGEYSPDVDPTMSRTAAALVQRVVPAPERVSIPGGRDPFGLDPSPAAASPARRSTRSWFGFGPARKIGIDPDRKEVTVRLRYTTAVIAGFAVCVVVALAYMSGRSSNRARAGANGVTSEQVRSGAILAGVLEVQPDRTAITEGGAETTTTPDAPETGKPDPGPAEPTGGTPAPRGGNAGPAEPTVANPPPPTPAPATGGIVTDLPRHNGLNYVLIQSYPDKKLAEEAKSALMAAGIPCTVQRPPAEWDQKLWAVIGTYGFPRTNSMREFRQYIEQIEAVSKRFAGTSKYKRFNPLAVKWKES